MSGDLFGLLAYPVNLLDQLLLLVIGGVSVGRRVSAPAVARAPARTPRREAPEPQARTIPGVPASPPLTVLDRLGRPMRDLRISVTDRCNFRCIYCMPREVFGPGFRFLPRADLLTFEEIARLARIFVANGVTKIRLTGGEPLLRRDLPRLVELLAAIDGLDDLAMTTNGTLLATHAEALARAGLRRVTVSLDSLDDEVFGQLNDVGMTVGRVIEGIEAAEAAGLGPIKIDTVVRRGINEDSILPLALEARRRGWIIRFIEYMDVGQTNGWRMEDVVPAAEILDAIDARAAAGAAGADLPGRGGHAGTGTATARGRWASSRASPGRSARPAPAHACPPRASSTCACSGCAPTTSRGRSGRARTTTT